MQTENGSRVTTEARTTPLWDFRGQDELSTEVTPDLDLTGFRVIARDGQVGKVDEATLEAGDSYVVVDTGMFSLKRVVLPAGLVDSVDVEDRSIHVDCTKKQIRNAPEIPYGNWSSEAFHADLDDYFGRRGEDEEDDARRPRDRERS
jgi:hypothetical protein